MCECKTYPPSECEKAIREAHKNSSAEGFFSARSSFHDTHQTRSFFNEIFELGWQAAMDHVSGAEL